MDCNLLSERCAGKATLIAEVEEEVGWPRLCDVTMSFGLPHTRGHVMREAIVRAFSVRLRRLRLQCLTMCCHNTRDRLPTEKLGSGQLPT